ncbi:MAG: hypothetical protein H0W76_20995 [Pyrinomonadaceae bacterium]|nr:hypothetical protein [Pyrinomonadaceae bacterium]
MRNYTKLFRQILCVVSSNKGLTHRILLAVPAFTLLWGGSFAAASNTQIGEEEFQRKMNKLKLHGNEPKQPSEKQSYPFSVGH